MYLRSNLVVVHSFLAVVKHISSKPKIRNTSFRASSLTRLFATPLTSQSLAPPFAIAPFSTVANINNIMPSPPYHYLSVDAPVLDCSSLASDINVNDEKRNAAYDTSRKLNVQLIRARTDMELPSVPLEDTAEALAIIEKSLLQAIQNSTTESTTASSMADRSPREANLSMRVEEYVRLAAFYHFLTTGTLMPPSRCASYATDEEYLAGACMGLCQELARYAIGRATTRDLSSVKVTRDLVQEILDYLLKFDFRNGPLRRKFDGTKYVLKTLETLLYELAVTGAKDNEAEEPDPKRMKVDQEENNEPAEGSISHLLDELEEIRKRMVHRDDLREQLIKKCRDGQKAAKQAIYALHRGDPKRSLQLLKQCEECITKDLLPIVKEEPGLRSGAFSNCLEEYAEAKLFHVWLLGNDNTMPTTDKPSGILLQMQDFEIPLQADEYLGGLCDLTGEIGRYAVHRGTARDFAGVKQCLEANSAVLLALRTMERLPGGINKKMDQLHRNVEKLERMTYELSLSEATGRNFQSEAAEPMEQTTTTE